MSTCQQKSSKKPWSTKEDATLLRLIDEYGSCGSWPKIALHMEWRTGKQCRERYINQLDPNIKKTPWTYEEDATIKRLHDQLGKKWSKFMDLLPGRSDNAIKNRWHVISRDNYAEHLNRSLYSVFQNINRSPAVKADTPDDLAAVRMARYRGDNVDAQHRERMPPVKEETLDALDCELVGLDSTDIDFDLCSFSEECGGEFKSANRNHGKHNDEGTTSPSMSPRTTNDLADGNEDENPGNTSFCDYNYSASNSYHSSHSHGELSSDRDSPIDLALLNDLLVGPEPSRNLVCNPSAALPATPDEGSGSTSVGTPVSPTAVAAVASPKAKPNSPTGKELQIQTNNSLYDFDYYFAHKAEGLNGGEPILHAGSLGSASIDEKGEQVCWKYDPNEDLALALEFLMSATASPAGASASVSAQRGSCVTQGESNRFSTGGNGNAPQVGGTGRSPNSSWYAMRDNNSPAGSMRMRPFSGNLASMASMLARSTSNTSNSRMTCDPELERVAVPVQPVASLSSRPLPAAPVPVPVPPVGVPASSGFNWQAPLQRSMYQSQNTMPEHSPMNHTHFSPSCPNSKRSRSKNPATFSW